MINRLILAAATFILMSGCKSLSQSSDMSSAHGASPKSAQSLHEMIALHQTVLTRQPMLFSQLIRQNDLNAAREAAQSMYETLEALEKNRVLEAQVCFGANESSCSAFRKYMSQDIKSLYQGFVVSNSLSTGELLKIATNIESSANLHYR